MRRRPMHRGLVSTLPSIPVILARRAIAVVMAVAVATSSLLAIGPAPVLAATFTVTTTADSGTGSLRQAILDANANETADVIEFAIPGPGPHVIAPASPLPAITEPVVIDGTVGGGPGIVLDGSGAGESANGLVLSLFTGTAEIRGLVIVDFDGIGIYLEYVTGAIIAGNYIGTDGTLDRGNGDGIVLQNATGTQILGNVISGNGDAPGDAVCCDAGYGIRLADTASSGTIIRGNLIGTDASGTAGLGNGLFGIRAGAPDTVIGGPESGDGNVVSGNGVGGIEFVGSATTGGVVQGNRIGTNAAGTAAIPNLYRGLLFNEAEDVLVGGTADGAGNLVAHNGGPGVHVAGSSIGIIILGNAIRDNTGLGIELDPIGPNPIVPGSARNRPVITTAGVSDIAGTLATEDGGSYRIEVFASVTCDPSGFGEGATFVDAVSVGDSGTWAMDAAAINGTYLTATATADPGFAGTSEFSECFLVTDGLPAAGEWAGAKDSINPSDPAPALPTGGTFLAAGAGPGGSAQFTYTVPVTDSNGEAGVWSFFTTASSSGTVNLPWRWTGLHAWFWVTAQLDAVVVRDGDTLVNATSLVNAGPEICCTSPSNGFDFTGTAAFTVQPGDVYGFVLRGSNADSNDFLQGELTVGTQVPTSCADAQDVNAATQDGIYVIHPVDGNRFRVYCHDMDTETAATYLEVRSGPGQNFGSYAAGGAAPGTTVTTSFSKLRLDPATLRVDIGDLTFATSTGSLTHPDGGLGNPTVTSMPYATAMACNSGLVNGTANVDLQGTPFAVDDAWTPVGSGSLLYGGATFSDGDQVVNIAGNGNCGWRTPYPEGPFYVFNPGTPTLDNTGSQFGLQLRYLVDPPAPTLATPVLFAAVATTASTTDLYALVDGTANASLTVEVRTSASCVGGTLGGSPVLHATVPVVTDAAGYLKLAALAGIPTGTFVAIRVVAPAVTADSGCVRTTADNDYWPKALVLPPGSTQSAQDVIEIAGKARWYRFPVVPDQRVTVTLSGLTADYDLAVFRDIAKEFESQLVPANTDDLHKLSAEFAPSVFSPSVFSPSVFSPSVFSPDAYAPSVFSPSVFSPSVFSPSVFSPSVFSPSVFSPSVFSPSVFSPSVFSPSVFSPSVFSPSVFSPSVFSPSVFSEDDVAQAFSSAQTRSIVGVSATPGTGDETVVVNTWNNTGYFYVRVSGRGGAFDPDGLFTVTVAKSASTCEGVTDTAIVPRAAAPGTNAVRTVILTDSSRLALGSPTDPASLAGKLESFRQRPEVAGVIVDVAADARVAQLKAQVAAHRACPFAVNLLAEEIKRMVDAYRPNNPDLRYVTIVGDDTVIPFFRYPDQSLLGQESGYFPPVRSDSISEASLRRDYVLSQDAYGSGVAISIRTSVFPIPGLAVGRLVETPAEIAGMLDAYVATNGVVSPGSSLVTGYDFLTDAADAVSTQLGIGTGASVNELITDADVSPLRLRQPGDTDPRRWSWTADDLRTKLLSDRHDVIYLAGHFSANSALAADYLTSVVTTELAASTVDLTNAVVFSGGCHSGYNLVDGEALTGVALELDWAQAFAQKRAVLIAGTGYQYGDTDFIEYSERLYADFSRELRAGPAGSAVSVGEALMHAKRTYLATTPDIRGIHEKALLISTLFGLPMFGVNMPEGRGAIPGAGAATIDPVEIVTGPAATLGLASHDLTLSPALTPKSLDLDVIGAGGTIDGSVSASWLEGPHGVVTNPAEPALPLSVLNVTSTNGSQVLRGVGFRGGTYTDTANMLPLTGAPTTELRGVHAPFVSPVFYPMRLWTPNYFGALSGSGGTNLLVTPAQHRSDDANPGRSIQRAYTGLNLRLFYSSNLTSAALSDAPTIVSVEATEQGADLAFRVQVVGDPAAAIHEVWITWTTGSGTWQTLDLVQSSADSRYWTGVLQNAPAGIQFVVQAANGVGLVAFDDNRGQYYRTAGTAIAPTTLSLIAPPSAGTFGDGASVTAELLAGGSPLAGRSVIVSIGGTSVVATTGANGRATVSVPLSSQPAITQVVASFGGDATHGPSSANAPFTIVKATSALTLTVPLETLTDGAATAVATLTGGGTPLIQRTVVFLLTPPGATGPTTAVTRITDFVGQARLALPTDLVGSYGITVKFGSVISLPGGATLDLSDPTYGPASASATHRVVWPWTGFFSPVDNAPTWNNATANQAIPVKFSLGGNRGLGIFAAGFPKVVQISCSLSGAEEAITEYAASSTSGLQYNATTGQYTYVWKTDKSFAKKCWQLQLRLADGSLHVANFKFK